MFPIFILIFLLSLFLAYRSMKDFGVPKEISHFINARRIKGSIVFFGSKTRHYKANK